MVFLQRMKVQNKKICGYVTLILVPIHCTQAITECIGLHSWVTEGGYGLRGTFPFRTNENLFPCGSAVSVMGHFLNARRNVPLYTCNVQAGVFPNAVQASVFQQLPGAVLYLLGIINVDSRVLWSLLDAVDHVYHCDGCASGNPYFIPSVHRLNIAVCVSKDAGADGLHDALCRYRLNRLSDGCVQIAASLRHNMVPGVIVICSTTFAEGWFHATTDGCQ